MITIKKYGNRRLYDTARSTYINLEDLTELVRAGHTVEVVDARTGEDLTREILLQIIMEVLRGADFFPTGMLRRVIRATGDDPAQVALRQQLALGLRLMSDQLDRMEQLIVPRPPEPSPRRDQSPPPKRDAAAERVAPHPTDRPDLAADDEGAGDELDELRSRLASLERRLKRG